MRIYETADYNEMSLKAADIMASQIISKPDSVLGLATGSTPEGMYQELIARYNRGEIDFSKVHTINLDEYVGLDFDNEQSYHYYMENKLFRHVNLASNNCHLLDGMEKDSQKECSKYEELIQELGSIDLQLLGVGENGHIGFNEPNTHFSKGTHLVALTPNTIEVNSRFFKNKDEVPHYAYTLGIKNIMDVKKILFMVNGKRKAKILRQIIAGPITPKVPASILQLHKDVTIVADKEALSLL
ncbi:MAG TPA: glucosamine-6-phosphate deaminase [Clostridiales bacterium]|nr:glucosamine-6-phosphate deaminase [Clostridiales bacterium]